MTYNAQSEAKLLEANIKINKLTSELEEANRVYLEMIHHMEMQTDRIKLLKQNNKDLRSLLEGEG